jgi:outer membrane lipoprotein carrier protein
MYESSKKSNGKLLYKRSQKIRWEIVSPRKQVILINGNSIRINEEGKEVASNSSGAVAKKIQKMMINLISGNFLNEKDFAISYFENSLSYKLILVPKNQSLSKYISSIVLVFDRKKMILSEMSLIESETDKVVYSFSSVVVNQNINDNKFLSFE